MCESAEFVKCPAILVSEIQRQQPIELVFADLDDYGRQLHAEFPRFTPQDPEECVKYVSDLAKEGLLSIAVSDPRADGYDQGSRPIFTQVYIRVVPRPEGIPLLKSA